MPRHYSIHVKVSSVFRFCECKKRTRDAMMHNVSIQSLHMESLGMVSLVLIYIYIHFTV
jgi:hypothetical protein